MPKRILIVGGGVIGLCAAYYCARRGQQVTVLERGPADHDSCALGSAGLVVPSHIIPLAAPGMVARGLKWMFDPGSPLYIRPRFSTDLIRWGWRFFRAANEGHAAKAAPLIRDLNLASRACYEEFATSCGNEFGLTKRGVLNLCRTPKGLDEEARIAERARRIGLEVEILDARQVSLLLPDLRMNIVGAVNYPQDCHMSPSRFMAGMKRSLDQLGVRFVWECELGGWRLEGKRIVAAKTAKGEFAADEFLVASGAWSSRAIRSLGINLPMQAGKGYSLTLTSPPRVPRTAAILSEARVAVTPMGDSLRFAGTMEIVGLDQSITMRRVNRIIAAACQYLPDFTPRDFQGIQPWRGLRPLSPDGLPYIGRFRKYANLSIAAGHAMMGLSMGPITGRTLSEILSGEAPSLDLTLLSPDRYS